MRKSILRVEVFRDEEGTVCDVEGSPEGNTRQEIIDSIAALIDMCDVHITQMEESGLPGLREAVNAAVKSSRSTVENAQIIRIDGGVANRLRNNNRLDRS